MFAINQNLISSAFNLLPSTYEKGAKFAFLTLTIYEVGGLIAKQYIESSPSIKGKVVSAVGLLASIAVTVLARHYSGIELSWLVLAQAVSTIFLYVLGTHKLKSFSSNKTQQENEKNTFQKPADTPTTRVDLPPPPATKPTKSDSLQTHLPPFEWVLALNQLGIKIEDSINAMTIMRYCFLQLKNDSESLFCRKGGKVGVVQSPFKCFVGKKFAFIELDEYLKGGTQQSKIRKYYECFTKKQFLKKRITSDAELITYRSIRDLQKKIRTPGLPKIALIMDPTNSKKYSRIFERMYAGNLHELYFNGISINYSFNEMAILVRGLALIHNQIELVCTRLINGHSHRHENLPGFHGDISPRNTVVKTFMHPEQGEVFKYRLIDFGLSGDYFRVGRAPGWLSPDYAKEFKEKGLNNTDLFSLNVRFATAKDIWQMGLLLGSILVGFDEEFKKQGLSIPSFRFMTRHLTTSDKKLNELDLAHITQQEIDDEIHQIKKNKAPTKGKENWNLIWDYISQMLKVDPEKRLSLKKSVLNFDSVNGRLFIEPWKDPLQGAPNESPIN